MLPTELSLDVIETHGQHGSIPIRVQIRVQPAARLTNCRNRVRLIANDERHVEATRGEEHLHDWFAMSASTWGSRNVLVMARIGIRESGANAVGLFC